VKKYFDSKNAKNINMKLKQLILLLLISSSIVSQNSLLWKISGNGLSRPSYIFGSIHAHDSNHVKIPSKIYSLIDTTGNIAVEVDITDLSKTMAYFEKLKIKQNEKTVADLLDSNYIKKLLNIARKSALLQPIGVLLKEFNAKFILLNLRGANQSKNISLNTYMDLDIIGHAKKKKISIYELESIKQQIDYILASKPSTEIDIIKQLQAEIDNYLNSPYDTSKMFIQYKNQEIDKLLEKSDFEDISLRNHAMFLRINKLLQIKQVFICVGAAHLPKEFGIIQLLKNKGYKMDPIKINVSAEKIDIAKIILMDIFRKIALRQCY
jgi:uncharacterized protein